MKIILAEYLRLNWLEIDFNQIEKYKENEEPQKVVVMIPLPNKLRCLNHVWKFWSIPHYYFHMKLLIVFDKDDAGLVFRLSSANICYVVLFATIVPGVSHQVAVWNVIPMSYFSIQKLSHSELHFYELSEKSKELHTQLWKDMQWMRRHCHQNIMHSVRDKKLNWISL